MGYYSEIGLCLNKAAHNKMLQELATQDVQIQKEVMELLTYADKYLAQPETEEESVLYHWTWVKWYSSYIEVKFIENFLENLPDDDDDVLQYRLVRIGEEIDDIAVLGSFYDNPFEMNLGRSVNINCQFSPLPKSQTTETITQ